MAGAPEIEVYRNLGKRGPGLIHHFFLTDAPGFYAAFPWGGYARDKGATGTRSDAISFLILIFVPLFFIFGLVFFFY